MPSFVPPNQVNFELHGAHPVLRMAVTPPQVSSADGWSLLCMASTCVVDGPGELGYLVARLDHNRTDVVPYGWEDAVRTVSGCTVVFGVAPNSPGFFVPVKA